MSRPPVVLLHGLASSASITWESTGLVELLRDVGRNPVTIDLLGHGRAPQPTDPAEYSDLAAWVADQMPDGPIDIVGFSLGARIAIEIAARRLATVETMVLAGVGANLFAEEVDHRATSAALADGLTDDSSDDPLVAHFRRLCMSSGSDPAAVAAWLRSTSTHPWPPDFSAITARCVVVVGDADFAGPADPLVDVLADASAVVVARADHFSLPKSMGFIDVVLDTLG